MLYSNIYVGISGVECEVNDFDFGNGIALTKTYAHLMAPFLMAFAPPPNRGQPHPAPWAAATGGLGFDMTLQLSIPSDSQSGLPYDSTTVAWWLIALMRLCVGPNLRAPAISSHPLSKESASSKELHIRPIEVEPCQLNIDPEARQKLSLRDLEWTKTHWATSLHLLDESPEFDLLFEAVDQAAFNHRPQLALLMLWAGIEEMFSPSKTELRYRISSLIAAYLEPPGQNRLNRQKNIAKLYDSRSTAAHGRAKKSLEPLWDTYDLARKIVVKVINEDHVPTKAELEERMFGAIPE
jgi:hypothetical protein